MSKEDFTSEQLIVRKHLESLGEHFDAVQIMATKTTDDGDGGTMNIILGSGNWFARYGMARMFIKTAEHDECFGREAGEPGGESNDEERPA